MKHLLTSTSRALFALLLTVTLLTTGGAAVRADRPIPDGLDGPVLDGLIVPAAAPVAPEISVARVPNTANALLSWEHVIESEAYQVWRGIAPYFDPAQGQGNQIAYLPAGAYGQGSIIEYTDDGVDRYSAGSSDTLLPTIQVIGDPATNYFWVVRGQNGDGVSENSNRVGEFDFALVKGG